LNGNGHQPSDQEQFVEYLNAGIKAAQSGDRKSARQNLMSALDIDPKSENAWLWLASISEYPEELLVFLNNVLDINPKNERALQWSASTKLLLSKTLVQRGVDAHENARSEFAVQCFDQALSYDMHNVSAWLWLAALTDDEQRRNDYFRRVLEIDPENETAKAAIDALDFEHRSSLFAIAAKHAVDGNADVATVALNQIFERWPNDKDSWALRSLLAVSFDEKRVAWNRLLELDPQNALAVEGLATVLWIEDAAKNANLSLLVQPAVTSEDQPIAEAQVEVDSYVDDHSDSYNADFNEAESYQVETQQDTSHEGMSSLQPDSNETVEAYAVADETDHVSHNGHEVTAHAVYVSDNDPFSSIAEEPIVSVSEPEPVDERLKILVIENNPTARRLMAGKLENSGYTVFCAETSRQAVDHAVSTRPSLVLADISMPGMDGYAICRTLRDHDETQNIPVVLISGKDAWYDEDLGQAAGASGFITKPFGPETLMKTVEQYLAEEAAPN
jgi:CheY-like chemotaxis protein/Tfp pilus assembly protein PilF